MEITNFPVPDSMMDTATGSETSPSKLTLQVTFAEASVTSEIVSVPDEPLSVNSRCPLSPIENDADTPAPDTVKA
ncbi:MAG: hypothetical protein R2710_13890 [Acidimicrobiales bacterium]